VTTFEKAVAEMRRLQKLYFRTARDAPEKREVMQASMAAERKVDGMLKAIQQEPTLL
jgi:hypothetical protein